ncbi:hypothetical protein PAXRUDRAFT_19645 [Paxillus rubicundulus Ve08.2h10]|uniref:Uncharacterized protein n=1 Tax=Paxillus rubicundulus Ve08.2h10 TaxID=930991 RepID=A0A0D0D3X3_9AGAM|nr:hypothetical protein PAXRUDRAFT_19645 [Paxillus rubicundulus Ve08.2h10]
MDLRQSSMHLKPFSLYTAPSIAFPRRPVGNHLTLSPTRTQGQPDSPFFISSCSESLPGP